MATPAPTTIVSVQSQQSSGSPQVGTAQSSYAPNHVLALVFALAAIAIIAVNGIYLLRTKGSLPYSGGAAAAAVAILLVISLLAEFPAVILDAAPQDGGEPSTMRILTLAVILTFCILALRTGWNEQGVPDVKTNWLWIIMAALGGKVAQKFAEIQGQSEAAGGKDKK